MQNKYNFCVNHSKEMTYLGGALGTLGWDQQVMMPIKAIKYRALQISTLSKILHEKLMDTMFCENITELNDNLDKLNDEQKVNVKEWFKRINKSKKLPTEFIVELSKIRSEAQSVWVEARKESNFKKFLPVLSKMIELRKKQAEMIGYKETKYDVHLDDFDPDMTVSQIDPIFEDLKNGLVPIIKKINDSGKKINTSVLTESDYDELKQERLCFELVDRLGLPKEISRFDKAVHPFSSYISPLDVRITGRYDKKWLPCAIYGAIHETGHALYNAGLGEENFGTPLGGPISYGMHESQSRLWENFVGRSESFVKFLFPILKRYFDSQLKGISEGDFYSAINAIKPSFIRVEADEATYNLHVILRYELEKALFADEIKTEDLPCLWNEKMEKYLGIRPKNDSEGVLQDIHWSMGNFGYFPSYTLGNIYAAQIFNKMKSSVKDYESIVESGNFEIIKSWLTENIYKHGRRYTASQLMKRVTGEEPNSERLVGYLKNKYGKIYGVKV